MFAEHLYTMKLNWWGRGDRLKRLGTALHLVQKKLIVCGEPIGNKKNAKLPRINSVVVNHKRVNIGRVSEIFGPTDRPYIVVKPYRRIDAAVHLGEKLYVEESRFSGRDRKDQGD